MNSGIAVNATDNGKGVFAMRTFNVGEVIMPFHGSLFTHDQLPDPYDAVEDHYVQISRDQYMGPSGGADDFVNHSCDPNAGLKINGVEVLLVAIRDILLNDEITWDYSTTMADEWEMDCRCGSAKCRKRIQSFFKLPESLQQRYRALGIVPPDFI